MNASALHVRVLAQGSSSVSTTVVKVEWLFTPDIFTSEAAHKCLSEPRISEQLAAACRKVSKKLFHFHGSQDPDAKAL